MISTYPRTEHQRPPTVDRGGRLLTSTGPGDQGHVLRLVLDLQIDALMLAIGAAAAAAAHSPPGGRPGVPANAPWARWVNEDVDLTRELVVEAITGGAALPATLDTEVAARDEQVVFARLTARYQSMRDLLRDLLDRRVDHPGASDPEEPVIDLSGAGALRPQTRDGEARSGEGPRSGGTRDGETRSGGTRDGGTRSGTRPLEGQHLSQVLARCQTRLVELHGLLERTATPPRPSAPARERTYLPGELLG